MKVSRLFVLGVIDWVMGLSVRRYLLEIVLRRMMGEAVSKDDGFLPEIAKQTHRMVKEEGEDKSNKNWCVEVDNSKDNSEMEEPTNLIGAHHLGHKKSSWRRLVNRHKSDSNMFEITIGKQKFNQESAEGPEPYSYVEDVTKRVKFDDENSESFTIVEALRPITKEDVNLHKLYRWLPNGQPIGNNETPMLECPTRDSSSYSKASTHVESL
ncbi:hypothetical protein Gotri_003716 [Gossypium trilobum]|uniref:Uncharacterized protein n=1 Tax=Gossypium trilobum TaxID=34281 RepID=A0A7J9F2E5_9ROSI|nr:hypothetical protein [Gossypium trilobum]